MRSQQCSQLLVFKRGTQISDCSLAFFALQSIQRPPLSLQVCRAEDEWASLLQSKARRGWDEEDIKDSAMHMLQTLSCTLPLHGEPAGQLRGY